jgi:uncharacterized membrane protein YedE/YeeE
MGHIRNVVLIIVFTAIMAVLTSILAYLVDQLAITSVLKHISNSLTDFIVVESDIYYTFL